MYTRRRNEYQQNQTKKALRCNQELIKNNNFDFDLLKQKVPSKFYSDLLKYSKAYKDLSCENYQYSKANNTKHKKKYDDCKTIKTKRDDEKPKVVSKVSSHFKKIVLDKTNKLKKINNFFSFLSFDDKDQLILACAIKIMLDTFNMHECRRNSSPYIKNFENLIDEFGKEVSKTKPLWVESGKNILKLIYYNEPDSIKTIKTILKVDKDLITMLYEFLNKIPICQN